MLKFRYISDFYLTIRSSKMKLHTHFRQRGMALVEVILIAVFLGVLAVGTTYFFAQTQTTLRSSSQTMGCQVIAKQALENVVSIGTRLYGYKINNQDASLQYNPLFIKQSGSSTVDVGDGSYLGRSDVGFPPAMYKDLFETLGVKKANSTDYNSSNPKKNSGVPLVTLNTDPLELGTSVLIISSVNALQYLYNSNKNFFTGNSGKGEKYTSSSMSDDLISKALSKYENKFNLENAEFYIKISPVDLKTDKVMSTYSDIKCYKTTYNGTALVPQPYTCPTDSGHTLVLTRPRLMLPSHPYLKSQITEDLVLVGNENIGFEIKVKLKYEQNDQEFICDAMHRFNHQGKTVTGNLAANSPLAVEVFGLTNGSGRDLLNRENKQTSCDMVDGVIEPNYKNITVELNFQSFKRRGSGGEEFGALLLCKGKTACRSDGEEGYGSCSVQETKWQRCHELEFPEQTGSTDAELSEDDKLKLTFNNLKENRRYDLSIKEVSMLEWSKSSVELYPNESQIFIGVSGIEVVRFYIDAKRPTVSLGILGDTVGEPDDGAGERNYQGPETKWTPPMVTTQWLQCDRRAVNTYADIKDQFTHNLEPCAWNGSRANGAKSINLLENVHIKSSYDFKLRRCLGDVEHIDQGRHTIEAQPYDTCDVGVKGEILWDTDLPEHFEAQDVDDKWFFSTAKIPYAIKTKVPSKTPEGMFPKHYSVTCFEKEYGTNIRTDGNSKTIDCKFLNGNLNRDDGCNPEKYGIRYHHVCGASGCKDSKKWAVYTPLRKSCLNVRCEPGLSCCVRNAGTCNGVNDKECGEPKTRHCTDPLGGTQTSGDEVPSGCPALGLNNCSYALPCEATSPCSETGPTSACNRIRQGFGCSYSKGGTCIPDNTGWNLSCYSSGTYTVGCARGTCNVGCASNCRIPCTHTCYNTCYNTCTTTDSNGVTTTQNCNPYNCNPYKCHGCHQYEYQAQPTALPTPIAFSGTCGVPSGGCSRRSVGGGNLTLEQCDVRDPTNPAMCPPPPPPPPPSQCNTSARHGCTNGGSAINQTQSGDRYYYLWNCESLNGEVSSECRLGKGISQCDYSTDSTLPIGQRINKCTNGGIPTNPIETTNYYGWKCTSPDDNTLITSDECVLRKPIPPESDCGTTKYACASPIIATNRKDNGCSWTWECPNPGGSALITSNRCELQKKVSECDKNSKKNACTSGGTAVDTRKDGDIWVWKCASPDGNNCKSDQCSYCDSTTKCCPDDTAATNSNCSLECGACGPWKGASDESCSSGTYDPHPPDSSTEYKWTCRNAPHVASNTCADKREVSCGPEPKPPIICGVCGTGSIECAGNGGPNKESCCSGGIFHSNLPDTPTHWNWTCQNDSHVASDTCAESSSDTDKRQISCSKAKPTVNECGVCGSYQGNSDASCSSGKFHPHPGHTATEYQWTCINDPHVASDDLR